MAVTEAHRAGRKVVAHAHGGEGIRNALEAGVDCIAHGIMLDSESIQLMKNKGVYLEPTISVYARILEAPKGVPQFMVERTKQVHDHHRQSLRAAIRAGVKVIAGTDSGSPYHLPPLSLVRELEIFAEEGMSPLEAIRAATGLAAEGVGKEQELGTIEVGHLADIIAVEGEPHKNLGALRAVRWVMKGGQISFNQTVPASQV